MNKNNELYEPSMVKEALCKHFKTPLDKSTLETYKKRFVASGGGYQSHYYYFILKNRTEKYSAFGKIALNNIQEYRALQYLARAIPKEQSNFVRPIALLETDNRTLLLLEYLEGYSHPFTVFKSLSLFPDRESNIIRIGKIMLENIYSLQKHFKTVYRPVSLEDTHATPGQPTPTSIFKQIKNIKSISSEVKEKLNTRINAILKNQALARRGVVHGALGMRNIMVKRLNFAFIDWEYMQYEALSIYDPCYIVTMLLMRGLQLCVHRTKLDKIENTLFYFIMQLEKKKTIKENQKYIDDVLWFGKNLAMIDTLWAYEGAESTHVKEIIKQKSKQIKYLTYCIEKDVQNRKNSVNAKKLWKARWANYIKISKRRSSSAMVTANNFIDMGEISRGSKILDLGCGHGRITELLVEMVPGLEIVGVDMTQQLLNNFIVKPGTNESKIKLLCGDIQKLSFDDNQFDAVVSSRVFQYLPNPFLGVREANRVLKPGGVLIISIPNKLNPIKYFTYTQKLYSPFQVRGWLEVCGFEDIGCGSMCFFPPTVTWERLADLFEIGEIIPVVKYFGGNVLVKGIKRL